MLKKFTVENFKIFKEPITLDFSKVREYRFNEECIKNQLINKAIIYGKNGIGKSNLGYALLDIRMMIALDSDIIGDEADYLNAISDKDFATFTYHFSLNNKEIIYQYEKFSMHEIKSEKLTIDGTTLYEYDYTSQTGDFSALLRFEEVKHLNLTKPDGENSIFRSIITNAKLKELTILNDLSHFVEGMALLRPLDGGIKFSGPKLINKGIIETIIEEKQVESLMEFLSEVDVNIKLKDDVKPDGEAALYFDYGGRPLEFVKNASSGTKALTALFTVLNKLDKVTFLYVDELDANLHFTLSEKIITLLKSKENCQIIISTHDTDLMSNKILRPDCYFLLFENKILAVSDATSRELREGHNLEKLYQSGEFDEMVSD